MATAMKTDAEKVTKLREMAKDKTLPQEVRNQYLDQATKLEEKGAMKAGVKLAKGGMAKKPAAKKMAVGGVVPNTPRDMQSEMKQQNAMKTATPKMVAPPSPMKSGIPNLTALAAAAPKPTAQQRRDFKRGAMAQREAIMNTPTKQANYFDRLQAQKKSQAPTAKPMMAKGGVAKKGKK